MPLAPPPASREARGIPNASGARRAWPRRAGAWPPALPLERGRAHRALPKSPGRRGARVRTSGTLADRNLMGRTEPDGARRSPTEPDGESCTEPDGPRRKTTGPNELDSNRRASPNPTVPDRARQGHARWARRNGARTLRLSAMEPIAPKQIKRDRLELIQFEPTRSELSHRLRRSPTAPDGARRSLTGPRGARRGQR